MKFKVLLGMFFFSYFIGISNASTFPDRRSCELLSSEFLKSDKNGKFHTDTFLVSKAGKIVFEWYDPFHTPETRHCLWSASKTVTSLIAGATIQKERMKLDDQIESYVAYEARKQVFPKHSPEDHKIFSELTIRHLINMNSALNWSEDYGKDIRNSSVLHMLYGPGYKDMSEFVLSLGFDRRGPGNTWRYSTGDTMLLSRALSVVNKDDPQYPWTILFSPLGIADAVFERDRQGIFLGGSSVFMSTRDMLKLGQLMLANGVWNGVQILPPDWMQFMRSISPGELNGEFSDEFIETNGVYGGGVWLNQSIRGLKPIMPHASNTVFFAAGHFGQYILMFPDKDMVVVRTGHDTDYWGTLDLLTNWVENCFGEESDAPIPLSSLVPVPDFTLPISESLYAMRSGLMASMVAKEFCSCRFITGLPLSECRERSHLPKSALRLLDIDDSKSLQLNVGPSVLGHVSVIAVSPSASAFLDPRHPEEGCRLYK